MRTSFARPSGQNAFTLVEMLVACAALCLLGVVLAQMTDQTARTWKYTSSKSEQFRETRTAFETMTTRISQATLNTFWDYDDLNNPTRYERRSELRFISGPADGPTPLLGDYGTGKRVTHCTFFHAPLGFVDDTKATTTGTRIHGLEGLLNIWGYFVELNDDSNLRPSILPKTNTAVPLRTRFRLMETMVPSERMHTYKYTSGIGGDQRPKAKTFKGRQWFQTIVNSADAETHVLAENVIALILHPELPAQDRGDITRAGGDPELAPDYLYDSTASNVNSVLNPKDQLPPVMRVTMVAIDEDSAVRLNLNASSRDIFGLSDKFQRADYFQQDLTLDPTLSADASLENKLVAMKVNYRVFTTTVPIRAAKWSRNQN